jgi:hypothetical protein
MKARSEGYNKMRKRKEEEEKIKKELDKYG